MTTTPLCPDIDDMAVDRLWVQFHALTGLVRELDSKLLDEIPRLDDRLEVLRIERCVATSSHWAPTWYTRVLKTIVSPRLRPAPQGAREPQPIGRDLAARARTRWS
jgi:hypothetical protein